MWMYVLLFSDRVAYSASLISLPVFASLLGLLGGY